MADLKLDLERIGARVRERFEAEKRVLSFSEYLDEFAAFPLRHTRVSPWIFRVFQSARSTSIGTGPTDWVPSA